MTKSGTTIGDGGVEVNWTEGDWKIFNGEFWDRIANNGTVGRVFGRKGRVKAGLDNGDKVYDYTWKQVVSEPYRIKDNVPSNFSSVFDLTNVEKPSSTSAVEEGSILRWDEAQGQWIISEDKLGITGDIKSEHIKNDEIVDDDISPDAAIEISKIGDLKTKLENRVNLNSGTLFGHLKTESALIFNKDTINGESAKINGVSLKVLHQLLIDKKNAIADKQHKLTPASFDYYFSSEDKNFKQLNTKDVSSDGVNGGLFLTNENVGGTKLSKYNDTALSTETGDVKSTESLVGAIKRFQDEITNGAGVQNFTVADIADKSVTLSHLAMIPLVAHMTLQEQRPVIIMKDFLPLILLGIQKVSLGGLNLEIPGNHQVKTIQRIQIKVTFILLMMMV